MQTRLKRTRVSRALCGPLLRLCDCASDRLANPRCRSALWWSHGEVHLLRSIFFFFFFLKPSAPPVHHTFSSRFYSMKGITSQPKCCRSITGSRSAHQRRLRCESPSVFTSGSPLCGAGASSSAARPPRPPLTSATCLLLSFLNCKTSTSRYPPLQPLPSPRPPPSPSQSGALVSPLSLPPPTITSCCPGAAEPNLA